MSLALDAALTTVAPALEFFIAVPALAALPFILLAAEAIVCPALLPPIFAAFSSIVLTTLVPALFK